MAERVISGDTYKFEKLNALEGIRMAGRVMKFFGPAWPYIDRLFDADEAERDKHALIAFGAIIQDLDVEEFVSTLRTLCGLSRIMSKTTGDYEPIEPEFHLRSEMDVFKVALFVLEVQCKDFFGAAWGSKLGQTVAQSRPSVFGESPPTSQKTSMSGAPS